MADVPTPTLLFSYTNGIGSVMKLERKGYNTTLRVDLVKRLKILAAMEDRKVNDLMEEAFQDLLKKYDAKPTDK